MILKQTLAQPKMIVLTVKLKIDQEIAEEFAIITASIINLVAFTGVHLDSVQMNLEDVFKIYPQVSATSHFSNKVALAYIIAKEDTILIVKPGCVNLVHKTA